MTNENLTLEKRLKKEENELVNYHPISPNTDYDRKTFIKEQGKLKDLGEYVQAINKDPYNLGAREDMCELLLGEPTKHVGMTPEVIRKIGNDAYSDGIENMDEYIKRNYNNVMKKLDGDGLTNLVMSLPLYKTSTKEYKHGKMSEDKEHNELVSLVNEIHLMNSDDKEIQGKVVGNALSNIMKSKEVPNWAKNLIQYFAKTDAHFVNDMFARYKTGREKVFSEYTTKDGKPDKDKLRAVIDKSLQVVNAEFNELDEKENKGERKDIREKAIRPYFIGIAQTLYKSEKKEFEKNIPEKNEKNKRKEFRSTLGIAA